MVTGLKAKCDSAVEMYFFLFQNDKQINLTEKRKGRVMQREGEER